MKIRHTLHALLAGAFLATAAATHAAPVEQTMVDNIGGVEFTFPVPPGYAKPAATPPAMRDLMIHALPTTNRLVAVMVTQQFLDELQGVGASSKKARYLGVQSFRSVEQSGVSPEVFDQLKAMFRNQSAQLLEKAKSLEGESTARISEDVAKLSGDSNASVTTSGQSLLGIFDEQPDSISLCAVQSLSTSVHDKKGQMKQVMAMTAVRLRGKVLMVGIYSTDDSPADVDWVKDQARAWNKRMHELNP